MSKTQVLLCFLLCLSSVTSQKCGYESCPTIDEEALNVHIVPHSHNSLGWLKSFNEYYNLYVQSIINSVLDELQKNPDRKFIQVETAYFHKWWQKQTDARRNTFKKLVNNGQLEIIGGGWSQNDEATTNYQSIIDQFTLGLKVIDEKLGPCGRPKIGWQIGPFGHSKEMASLFAQFGYDAVLFGRLDWRDKQQRYNTKSSEMIWQGSSNLGNNSNIFTSILYNSYMPPSGFCFDILCKDRINNNNKNTKVTAFDSFVRLQSAGYPTDNVIVTMGGDFTYSRASKYYKNLDFLIKAINEVSNQRKDKKRIKAFYSTPSCYVKAVNEMANVRNISFKLKTNDFFPYSTYTSYTNSYYTGFYTSRPTLKRYEREANNLLQVSKQMGALLGCKKNEDIISLSEAVGLMQHHDAITGTERQAVVQDFSAILSKAIKASINMTSLRLRSTIKNGDLTDIEFGSCMLSNISLCSQSMSNMFVVALYNPLARNFSSHVRIPVDTTMFIITDAKGRSVDYQVTPSIRDFSSYFTSKFIGKYELTFLANILGLGTAFYHIQKDGVIHQKGRTSVPHYLGTQDFGFTISSNGLLQSVRIGKLNVQVTQQLMYYTNNVYDASSGAYSFQPQVMAEKFQDVKYKLFYGKVFDEVHQYYDRWATQVIRVYKDKKYIEIDWVVGIIDISDGVGKEVISRFETNLNSGDVFYTDSNGRETIQRTRNYRETYRLQDKRGTASNYYPVTSHLGIEDKYKNIYMTIFNDRAQGGTSLESGQVELMLHRRLLSPGEGGLDEPLNEQNVEMGAIARGKLIIDIGLLKDKDDHGKSKEILLKPWIFYSKTEQTEHEFRRNTYTQFTGIKTDLPKNVHLLTLEQWNVQEDKILLRLEHTKENTENAVVDLTKIFTTIKIISLDEMTLAANQRLNENQRLNWTVEDYPTNNNFASTKFQKRFGNWTDFKVILRPMQIRTFIAKVEYITKNQTEVLEQITKPENLIEIKSDGTELKLFWILGVIMSTVQIIFGYRLTFIF